MTTETANAAANSLRWTQKWLTAVTCRNGILTRQEPGRRSATSLRMYAASQRWCTRVEANDNSGKSAFGPFGSPSSSGMCDDPNKSHGHVKAPEMSPNLPHMASPAEQHNVNGHTYLHPAVSTSSDLTRHKHNKSSRQRIHIHNVI